MFDVAVFVFPLINVLSEIPEITGINWFMELSIGVDKCSPYGLWFALVHVC